ncbi:hypothetical protein IVA80_13520 [Bradyrhizobium sp. 139]|nr:hypothetical protein [Bradyrhizobium sp. 139]
MPNVLRAPTCRANSTKTSKTTPCTVADRCWFNELRKFRNSSLTRRAKHWQDVTIEEFHCAAGIENFFSEAVNISPARQRRAKPAIQETAASRRAVRES